MNADPDLSKQNIFRNTAQKIFVNDRFGTIRKNTTIFLSVFSFFSSNPTDAIDLQYSIDGI
jgi:hypothetical protein